MVCSREVRGGNYVTGPLGRASGVLTARIVTHIWPRVICAGPVAGRVRTLATGASGDALDLAQIGAVRSRSADGIERRGADDQVEVGSIRSERIIAGCADLGAGLPPAVFADHDIGVEAVVEPSAGAYAPLRRLDRDPVSVGDTAPPRRCGMEL